MNKQLHSLFYLLSQVAVFMTDNRLPMHWIMPFLALLALPAVFVLPKVPNIN